ncbi:MAG: hypothetical protein EOO72_08380 [Myxococcaceae bacterium]|nr:MAG: hypothetical protein EOO72_08380 [Myxococcaceae bacterium]
MRLLVALYALSLAGCCCGGKKPAPAGYTIGSGAPGAPAPPTTPANGVTGWRVPTTACAYLAPEGLGGGGAYKKMGDEWTCASPGLNLSAPNSAGLANTLRFFAEGSQAWVGTLKLYANVNVPGQAPALQKRMGELAAQLTQRALGAELPADARAALTAGRAGTWRVGGVDASAGARVTLERDVWPTGKGFSLRFTIE